MSGTIESKHSRESFLLVPRFSKQGFTTNEIKMRREWLQNITATELGQVGAYSIDSESMRGNIENAIGTVQVPLGVAGPLKIEGEHAHGTFYVPLATTEGALVRSYERGMMAVTRSGHFPTAGVSGECEGGARWFLRRFPTLWCTKSRGRLLRFPASIMERKTGHRTDFPQL